MLQWKTVNCPKKRGMVLAYPMCVSHTECWCWASGMMGFKYHNFWYLMFFSVVVMMVGAHLCHQDELQVLHNISMTGLLETLKINKWSRETNAKCSNKIESTDSNNCFLFLSIPWSIDSFQYWPTLTLWYHPLHTSWKFSFRLYQRKGTAWFLIAPTGRLFFVCCKCLSHVAAELNTTITIKLNGEAPASKRTVGGYLWGAGRSLYFGFVIPLLWGWETSWHRWRRREHGRPWLLIVWCNPGWPTLWHL